MMEKRQVYQGIVRTGRGAGAGVMSAPGVLEGFRLLTGLSVIPGTLNVELTEPCDLTLLDYINLADKGFKIDLLELGIEYEGELGMHYGRVVVDGKYPAGVIFFNWVPNPTINAELVSPHHLRNTLGLHDGDSIEFTLL
jgi:CTP-dependent riboflavin kinase